MTFVTAIAKNEQRRLSKEESGTMEVTQQRSVSASKAFKLQITTSRPSILIIPSACSRERLRETSSRTVPICDANSWLLTGRVITTPSADAFAFFLSKTYEKRC